MVEIATGVAYAGIDSVLIAEETASDEHQTVAFGVQGHGLSEASGIVFDGDVLEGDVLSFHLDCISTEGSHALRLACGFLTNLGNLDVGMVIIGDDGLLSVFSAYLNVGEP